MKEFWRQLNEATGAIVVLAGVATSCYIFGVTQRPRIGTQEAIAAQKVYVDSVLREDETRHAQQDAAAARLSAAVSQLSRQVCLLTAQIEGVPPTKECAL